MSEPRATENVLAYKRDAGRVMVHGVRRGLWERGTGKSLPDCGRAVEWTMAWLWVEYRTLNPERVLLCRRCWK